MSASTARLRRLMVGGLGAWCLVSGCASSSGGPRPAGFAHDVRGAAVPWTNTRFDSASGDFTFAIFSDLNGGERPGVFDVAAAQLALLRPALVMSVGDLIDGPSPDPAALTAEWESFDARARRIPAPVFRVGGNHDLTGQALRDVWATRYGPRYYAFTYRDVLFLVLDTEDHTPERMAEMMTARSAAIEASRTGVKADTVFRYDTMPERLVGNIGAEQSAYVRRAIAEHPDVRWTFLFLHKPVWQGGRDPEFTAIESALAGRPYTVFNGHLHAMSHTTRLGRDYIMLGTTGGGQAASAMAFDHVTLVRVTADGPSIAHLRLDGILDRTGHVPMGGDSLCFRGTGC